MVALRAELVGSDRVIAGLLRANDRIKSELGRAHLRIAKGGEALAKGKASGRPGPRVVTGDFRRSIVGQFIGVSGGVFQVQIGSNAPPSRRLEYGFVGPDILGRVYNQPPYPWLGPAQPAILELARTEIQAAVQRGIGAA